MEALADVYRKQQRQRTKVNHKGLNKITVRSPHNPGKTHWLAKEIHWFNFCFRGRVVATAPKEDQLKTRLWPEFRKVMQDAVPGYSKLMKVDTLKITWANDPDWVALAETAATGENLAGHHWDYLLILIDEASGVREELFPVIEAALGSGIFVALIMIGNPTRTTGSFHASHCKARVAEQYFHKHIKPGESKRISKQWIRDMITKYGRKSPVVKVRCFGEFAETEADQLIALEWLQAARDRVFVADGSLCTFRATSDIADGGMNETVVFAGKAYASFDYWMKLRRFSHPAARAPILAADELQRIFEDYGGSKKHDDMVVDAIGVGAGTAGTLMVRGFQVITFRGGAASDQPKLWRNKRVQSNLVMRNRLRDGQVIIAPDFVDSEDDWDDFCAQMCSVKSRPGTERLEDLVSKQEMIRKGVVSPDMVDAVAEFYATDEPQMVAGEEPVELVGRLQSADYEDAVNF